MIITIQLYYTVVLTLCCPWILNPLVKALLHFNIRINVIKMIQVVQA